MELLPVPFEIRQQIYNELLVCRDHIFLELAGSEQADFFAVVSNNGALGLHPSVLGVNRATNAEAAAALYARNRFRITYAPHRHPRCPSIEPFFRHIGPANARLLRHVCLQLVALVREIRVQGVWRAALLSDDEETVGAIRRYCPGLEFGEAWILPQSGHPRRLLSVEHWHDGAASMDEVEMKWCTIDEFVLVYSIKGSELTRCTVCWEGYTDGLFRLRDGNIVPEPMSNVS